MEVSVLHPATCGFVKVAAYELATSNFPLDDQIDKYCTWFSNFNEKFTVSVETQRRNFPKIVEKIRAIGKRKKETKAKIVEEFSTGTWEKLSMGEKNKHSLLNCIECTTNTKYIELLNAFPVKKQARLHKAQKTTISNMKKLSNITQDIYNKANNEFKMSFPTLEFSRELTMIPALKLSTAPSYEEKRKANRVAATKFKKAVESHQKETAVLRTFGTELSLAKRQKIRMVEYFETPQQCKERSLQEKQKINSGKKCKKVHVPSNIPPWKSNECLEKVRSYPEGHAINFSQLAKEHGLRNNSDEIPKNGGQIVKNFLEENRVDVNKYEYKLKGNTNLRRKKRKIEGTDISIPTDTTNEEVKSELAKLIIDGRYTTGEPIVPQMFQKLVLNSDFNIEIQEFEVSGRKIPLREIREKQYHTRKGCYRLFTYDEISKMSSADIIRELERINEIEHCENQDTEMMKQKFRELNNTRYLQFWHDGSSISNHSHLLMVVNTMYDKAIHFTNEEYEQKYGEEVDVQGIIEKPDVYILARCPSDDHQLMYSDCRNEDIKLLRQPINVDGGEMYDIVRFFHGDGPACALEAGQQKNGRFPCWICPANFDMGNDLSYMLSLPNLSLDERMQKVMQSECSQAKIREGKTKLFSNLKKHEIADELHQRNIAFRIDSKKAILQEKLMKEMHGIQRFPSLTQADKSVASLLKYYEVLGCEPLHDVKNHIENIYSELTHHLRKDERKLMEDMIQASFERKETKRGVDYRKSLIKINIALRGKINKTASQILSTLCEIQDILYCGENERTIEKIFRLHNQTFLHACLLKDLIGSKPKVLTERALWGKYYHAIVCHAPPMLRLVSGKAANAELEERTFNTLKTITKSTSNQHPEHVILNNMIRLQVRQELNEYEVTRQDHEIRKLCCGLPEKTNSVVPFWIIDKYRLEWQAHLERVADYINDKCWWIETNDGIMFSDCKKNKDSVLKPHHFRSSNVKAESSYLKACWEKCLSETTCIPARKIYIEKSAQEITTTMLDTIAFFRDPIMEDVPLPSSAISQRLEIEDIPPFPPYIPRKRKVNDADLMMTDEGNDDLSILSANISNEPSVSIKRVTEDMIQKNMEDNCIFKSKTASYIYQVLPKEMEIVKEYDHYRRLAKTCPNDREINNDFLHISAQIEIRLLMEYDKLKKDVKDIEIKQIVDKASLSLIPSNEFERVKYNETMFKLKIIRALRSNMKF